MSKGGLLPLVIMDDAQGNCMRKDSGYLYRVLSDGDEDGVKALIKSVFGGFLGGDYWEWKYRRNPDFDPSLVVVAEKDGEVVGCNHWLVRNFKLSDDLVVKAALGADIAVSPKHRRRGIGKSLLLLLRSSKAFKEKKAVISYMYPNPEMINPLYRPAAFYVAAPNLTTRYTKILNWNKLKKRLEKVNRRLRSNQELQAKLSRLDLRLLFHIGGSPPLPLRIGEDGLVIDEAVVENPDVVFRVDLGTLESFGGAKNKTLRLIGAWLRGKLRIKGSLSHMVRLGRNFWIFHEIFG